MTTVDRRHMVSQLALGMLGFAMGCVRPAASRLERAQGGTDMGAERERGSGDALQPVTAVVRAREQHWVGDGFYVSTIFSPHRMDAQLLSPFIMMDYGAPRHFEPTQRRRGVGEHPHRGFETVTFAYQGEVDHRDSYGGGGTIMPGDVQWMTAASGVVHEEMHSERFAQTGGLFEMVQLWVNLPARLKMTSPRYQALKGQTFGRLSLGGAKGRVIAGEVAGVKGPALTHSPITLFDLEWSEPGLSEFALTPGTTTLLFFLNGQAQVQGSTSVQAGSLVIMDRSQPGTLRIEGDAQTKLLVLNGEPLNEPVVAHGPFVMNTRDEIITAIRDYQRGAMGSLKPSEGQSG